MTIYPQIEAPEIATVPPSRRAVAAGGSWRSWLREPLLHFLVLGAALFLIWPLIGDKVAPPPNRIVISAGQMQRAVEIFYQTHLRLPDPQELSDLVASEIRTEVYYREGVALGLDRDDEIIRRRVQQKLEFMTQDTVDQEVPSEAELQHFLDTHRADFGGEPQIAFSQVYLDPDRHADHLDRDAAQLLARLNSGDGRLDYGTESDVLPVPNDFEATPLHGVAEIFGQDFADAVAKLQPGQWVGPIHSGYGEHLVLVREKKAAVPPQLAQVHDAVLREWQSQRRVEANLEAYQRMRDKYVVEVQMPQGTAAAPATAAGTAP